MTITPQERIVLLYIVLGYSDKEIAHKMKISYSTLRTYIDRGTLKMNGRNKIHAAFKYLLTLSPDVYKKTLKDMHEVL